LTSEVYKFAHLICQL